MNRLSTRLLARSSLLLNSRRAQSTIGVIGVPFGRGQRKPGTEQAPDALRQSGLVKRLEALHPSQVIDLGNINFELCQLGEFEHDLDGWKVANATELLMVQMCRRLSGAVEGTIKRGMTPLVIGGDHSIAVGSIMGSLNAVSGDNLALLWVDAHADVNTETTSPTGNYHGMPLSFCVREITSSRRHQLLRRQLGSPEVCLPAKNIAHIGLRDVDLAELQLLKQYNIAHFSMNDVDKLGIRQVVARALEIINPKKDRKVHVSFDVDSVDNLLIPSTGTGVPGGLTLREALTLAEMIHDHQRMLTLDIVEFNPQLGDRMEVKRSAEYINNIILTFFGKSRVGEYHKHFDET